MTSSSLEHQEGEFILYVKKVQVFAPIMLTDEQGEALAEEVIAVLENAFGIIKASMEEKFPQVRVGYDEG